VTRTFSLRLAAAGFAPVAAGSLGAARAHIAAAWGKRGAPFDVVLVDLVLPDGDGEELVPLLTELRPTPAVAIFSGHLDGDRSVRLLAEGIWPVPKPIVDLITFVRRVHDRGPAGDVVGAYCRAHGLSARQTELVRAAAMGLRNDEASKRLGCAPHTTTGYWQRIFEKTGQRSQPGVLGAIVRFATQEPSP
jgi:DNA-binding NarL/FixJ family response regulator